MLDYPLKFDPISKEKIWGGEKLKNVLHKPFKNNNIGESWEISGLEGDASMVSNGKLKGSSLKELLTHYKAKLIGNKNFNKFGAQFPLLIKFIDAKTPLSVQLHPNDALSKERHNSFGKTEMWYVLQADEAAELNVGFNRNLTKEEYISFLKEGKITEILHFEKVKKGDSVFISPGKVHAIGAGVLLAEIQQTSDITYRIYDYDRRDSQGNKRELHTDLALDAIALEQKDDFKLEYEKIINQSSEIAHCPYFTTNFLPVHGVIQKDYQEIDSFVIYMCVEGKAEISVGTFSEEIKKGETILIPAQIKNVQISSSGGELLEVYV